MGFTFLIPITEPQWYHTVGIPGRNLVDNKQT